MSYIQIPIEESSKMYSANTCLFINMDEVTEVAYKDGLVSPMGEITMMGGRVIKVPPSYTTFWDSVFAIMNATKPSAV